MGYFSNYSSFMYRWWDNYWQRTPVVTKNTLVDAETDEFIEVNIYISDLLFDRNGRTPEKMAARFISKALERAGYNYKITRNLERVDPPSERSVCGGECPLTWWRDKLEEGEYDKAKDSNILMLDSHGGGCAIGKAKNFACTVPGKYLREMQPHTWQSEDAWASNISGTLHEFGHNLELWHDHDMEMEGRNHTGTGWNEDSTEMWHRTPMNVDNGIQNYCGEDIPKREYKGVMKELYFHDCSVENFGVK